uniref:Uncharacterized protein n=1 Tax=Borrelia hermsii TaxID=140 RepID=S4VQK2_BORHE|nr:hypothetical protein BHA121 [Borrelia hermsii]
MFSKQLLKFDLLIYLKSRLMVSGIIRLINVHLGMDLNIHLFIHLCYYQCYYQCYC